MRMLWGNNTMEMKNEFLDFLEKLASLIAETFGNNCEVVISDLDRPESAILAIFNNHVTNRKVGDPLIPQALKRVQNSADDYYINFEDFKGGKLLKTSTLSAHIGGRHIAFCINYDYTHLDSLRQSLDEFLTMQRDSDLRGFHATRSTTTSTSCEPGEKRTLSRSNRKAGESLFPPRGSKITLRPAGQFSTRESSGSSEWFF